MVSYRFIQKVNDGGPIREDVSVQFIAKSLSLRRERLYSFLRLGNLGPGLVISVAGSTSGTAGVAIPSWPDQLEAQGF